MKKNKIVGDQKDLYNEFQDFMKSLKYYNVYDNLYVIRQYHFAAKSDNWKSLQYIENSDINRFLPQDINFLIANSILYCHEHDTKISLRSNSWRHKLFVRMNKLEEKVHIYINKNYSPFLWFKNFIFNQENLILDKYQIIDIVYRYMHLYKNIDIKNKIGISYDDYILNIIWIYYVFEKRSWIINESYFTSYNNNYEPSPINKSNTTIALSSLTKDVPTLKKLINESALYSNLNMFNFVCSPHMQYPIIRKEKDLLCAVPEHIITQATRGMYYMVDIPSLGVDKLYGDNFENHIGDILSRCNSNQKYEFKKEISIIEKKQPKKSSDWIVFDENYIVFIECKTKKLKANSKLDLNINDSSLSSDIETMACAIKQIYISYGDYYNNKYPELPYNPNLKFIPLVVTLENWYTGIPEINDKIRKLLEAILPEDIQKIKIQGMYPFKILSCSDFERDIQIIGLTGIGQFVALKQKNCITDNYIRSLGLKPLYINDFKKDFIEPYKEY